MLLRPLRADQTELKLFFVATKLPVKWSCGRWYVVDFVGSKAIERKWVEEKVEEWVGGVGALVQIAKRCQQTAYAGFVMLLQSE